MAASFGCRLQSFSLGRRRRRRSRRVNKRLKAESGRTRTAKRFCDPDSSSLIANLFRRSRGASRPFFPKKRKRNNHKGHPIMISTIFFDFLSPPPCPHLEVIYTIKFMQPPLLCGPLPSPLQCGHHIWEPPFALFLSLISPHVWNITLAARFQPFLFQFSGFGLTRLLRQDNVFFPPGCRRRTFPRPLPALILIR